MNQIDLMPKKIESNYAAGVLIEVGSVIGLIAWALSGVGWGFGIALGLILLCVVFLMSQKSQWGQAIEGRISPTSEMQTIACFAMLVFMWQVVGIVVLCAKWIH